MRRLITIITVAGLVLAAGSSGAVAASKPPLISIGVAPSKLQANLYPGQLYKTDLDIYNKGGASTPTASTKIRIAVGITEPFQISAHSCCRRNRRPIRARRRCPGSDDA